MSSIKNTLLTVLMMIASVAALAQKVKETTVKKGKEHVPGYMVKYKHSKTDTRDVIKQQLADAGYAKAKHKKGFYTYKGIMLPAISPNKADYYIKISGNKRRSTVYFVASKGYDNYISSTTDAAMSYNINSYLQNLDNSIETKVALDKKQAELNQINKDKQQKEKEIKQLEEKSK